MNRMRVGGFASDVRGYYERIDGLSLLDRVGQLKRSLLLLGNLSTEGGVFAFSNFYNEFCVTSKPNVLAPL